jgi:hypothetical protein
MPIISFFLFLTKIFWVILLICASILIIVLVSFILGIVYTVKKRKNLATVFFTISATLLFAFIVIVVSYLLIH